MLADAGELVVLLPIAGFYGQEGGSTVLTADGRVRLSPPLQYGAGAARDPWQAIHAVATQLDRDLDDVLDYTDAEAIRKEIDACVPALAGIGGLKAAGEWVRPGGRHAGTEATFPRADGRARFGAPSLSPRPALQVVARKSLPTGTPGRDTILLSDADAAAQGIASGDTVELTTEHGVYTGAACVMHMPAGAAHVCMPEAAALLPRVSGTDPVVVTLRRRP
jgi:anaerobic selenocysteine-containing dehydrogenase